MKTCDEMMNSLLKRREAYLAAQKKKKKVLLSVTSTLCVAALMGVVLWQSGWMTSPAVTEPQGGTEEPQESEKSTMPSYPVLRDTEGENLNRGGFYTDAEVPYGDDGYTYQYDKMCGINLSDLLRSNDQTDKIALFVRSYSYTSTLFEFKYKGKTVSEYSREIAVTPGNPQSLRDAYNEAIRAYQRYAAVQLQTVLEQKGFDCYYTEGQEYLLFFATEEEFAALTLGEGEDRNWKYDWATEPMPMLASGGIDREFVYKGKTVDEYYGKWRYDYDNLETKYYNLIHEEGELLEKGRDLYLTTDPDGNPWLDICGVPFTKQTYDNYVKEYGDMLTKYIVDGKFLKEKAQADWDAIEKERDAAIKLYEEACDASQKYNTDRLKEKLEQYGYECTYTEDGTGVIFYISYQEYITMPAELRNGGSYRWVKLNDDGTIYVDPEGELIADDFGEAIVD